MFNMTWKQQQHQSACFVLVGGPVSEHKPPLFSRRGSDTLRLDQTIKKIIETANVT